MSRKTIGTTQYTQFPNWLLARIYNSNDLTVREMKVFLYIVRKTYGFHKVSDKIPYSQISQATGIDQRNTIKVVKSLEQKGYISVSRKDRCINMIRVKSAKKGCVPADTSGCVKNDGIDVSEQTPSKENQKQPTSGVARLGVQTLVENKYDEYDKLMNESDEYDEYK